MANLNKKIAGTRNKLVDSSKEIVRLADDILVLKDIIDKQTQEIQSLTEKVTSYAESDAQIEIDSLNAELTQLNEQLATKKELEAAAAELLEEQRLREMENVKKELSSLIKLNATLQKELNLASSKPDAIENKKTPSEKLALSRYAVIQQIEKLGFAYKYFTTNLLGEEIAVGVKQRGDHLVIQLFYSNPSQAAATLPTASIRLLSSRLYDYRILHHDTAGNPSLNYDVEVKTEAGEAKIAKYTSGYLEQLDSNSEIGSGNGKLLLEAIVSELKVRGINNITSDLTTKSQPNFSWLKPYLIKQGFQVPADNQLGKVIKTF